MDFTTSAESLDLAEAPDLTYRYPVEPGTGGQLTAKRPVIAGFGPCGMFCALILSQMGLAPIVIERGKSVDERTADIAKFWKDGELDTESNVQFGEGGAGTFSDGKLTTGIKDPRVRKVIEEFAAAGAPADILIDAKPHIGTDILKTVVKNIRLKIIAGGGEVRFGEKLESIVSSGNVLKGIRLHSGETIAADDLVLAVGHSARDTFMRSAVNYADIFYQTLRDNGIECYLDNNGGYFDRIEIMTFTDLLRVTDNIRQDVPLLGVLRSPIFGFSIDELIAIRTAKEDVPFYDAFISCAASGEDEKLKEKAAGVLSALAAWKEEAGYLPVDEFVWKLMNETDYYTYAGTMPGGRIRQTMLRVFVEKAGTFSLKGDNTIYGLIRYIDNMKIRSIDLAQPNVISENDDVVRIMTIHKSKGLEFPMVILAGLGKDFRSGGSGGKWSFHNRIGIGMDGSWKDELDAFIVTDTLLYLPLDICGERETETIVQYVGHSYRNDSLETKIAGLRFIDHLLTVKKTDELNSKTLSLIKKIAATSTDKNNKERVCVTYLRSKIEDHLGSEKHTAGKQVRRIFRNKDLASDIFRENLKIDTEWIMVKILSSPILLNITTMIFHWNSQNLRRKATSK